MQPVRPIRRLSWLALAWLAPAWLAPAFLAPALLALAWPGAAGAQPIADAVRERQWSVAAALAAQMPDPVAAKLVTYEQLLTPGQAGVEEYDRFIAASPDWPLQGSLARRRDEALAAEPDDARAAAACARKLPDSAAALQRCAIAETAAGQTQDVDGILRRAWVALPDDAGLERVFLAQWPRAVDAQAAWARFDRLAWAGAPGAARQIPRLDAAQRPVAQARLDLRRDAPDALAEVEALPMAARREPVMVLERARYLRRAGQDTDALALWLNIGHDAEAASSPDRRPAFWEERNILVRHRLRDGDPQGAYALADGQAQTTPEKVAEAQFLAGFIALRKLDDAARALPHFQVLADISTAAITQGRAHFWIARASGDGATARREYERAAAYPETFYGQLAVLALTEGPAGITRRITSFRDPGWDAEQALAFTGRELARAAAMLASWGELGNAQPFLLRLTDIAPDPADLAMAARLAQGLGMPETAIAIARRAGRDGVVLLDTGWPRPVALPPGLKVDPALVLGIIRQESSFDAGTTSPAGALGLMQLMPGTASQIVRVSGGRFVPNLLTDPRGNVELGSTYLRQLLDQFDGCTPLAVAAYNAGPTKVQEWLGANGDPRQAGVEMIDWIELIPYGETRNYVQRVIENQVIYAARAGTLTAHPLAQWLR